MEDLKFEQGCSLCSEIACSNSSSGTAANAWERDERSGDTPMSASFITIVSSDKFHEKGNSSVTFSDFGLDKMICPAACHIPTTATGFPVDGC